MMKQPSLTDVKANLNLNNPEMQVNIDRPTRLRSRRARLDVAGAVRLLMSGEDRSPPSRKVRAVSGDDASDAGTAGRSGVLEPPAGAFAPSRA